MSKHNTEKEGNSSKTSNHENGQAPEEGVGTQPGKPGEGPKFYVDIEGETYPWDEDEITVSEIRDLGDLPENKGVLLIDLRTQEQETLDEGETVELKPGMGFSQKFRFKRGVVAHG
jgi:hypothetical protein